MSYISCVLRSDYFSICVFDFFLLLNKPSDAAKTKLYVYLIASGCLCSIVLLLSLGFFFFCDYGK